ncbi:aspartate/glutamate racemase family protein [Gemmatimonadota bacterium]
MSIITPESSRKIVGIIGGMGPEATAEFYMRLVKQTPADRDQDHLHVVMDGNAAIPDRTESFRNNSNATMNAIVTSALRLEKMGAEVMAMPCNNAHLWYEDITARLSVPLLNMVEEVFVAVKAAGLKRVGLLATAGTVESGLYERYAGEVDLLLPSGEEKIWIHEAIYEVKAGSGSEERVQIGKQDMLGIVAGYRKRGAEGVILGCTEVPLLIGQADLPGFPVFDSTDILVDATLREALPR